MRGACKAEPASGAAAGEDACVLEARMIVFVIVVVVVVVIVVIFVAIAVIIASIAAAVASRDILFECACQCCYIHDVQI